MGLIAPQLSMELAEFALIFDKGKVQWAPGDRQLTRGNKYINPY